MARCDGCGDETNMAVILKDGTGRPCCSPCAVRLGFVLSGESYYRPSVFWAIPPTAIILAVFGYLVHRTTSAEASLQELRAKPAASCVPVPAPEPEVDGLPPEVASSAPRVAWTRSRPPSEDDGRSEAERAKRHLVSAGVDAREGVTAICKDQGGTPHDAGKKVACYGMRVDAQGFAGEGDLWWELKVEP